MMILTLTDTLKYVEITVREIESTVQVRQRVEIQAKKEKVSKKSYADVSWIAQLPQIFLRTETWIRLVYVASRKGVVRSRTLYFVYETRAFRWI